VTLKDKYLQDGPPAPKPVPGFIAIEPYKVGRHSYICEFTHISQYTTIGNFCSIGNLCTIGAQRHPLHYLTTFPFDEILDKSEYKATTIGNDVWIGSNAVVVAGVTVGDGAVIGGGAVVTEDVQPYAIVIGNPAKVLKYRFPPEIIAGLLETRWWDLPAEEIVKLPILEPERCIAQIRGLLKARG
jgi:acetyltransferase-like isoleucine patch superfamily enzyme